MSTKKIKKIEELVSSVLQCLDSLYSENRILEQKVQELEKEKKILSKENEMVRDSLEKLKQLKISHRMLEKERSAVRIKVKNVLQKIEKMDFV